MDRNKEIKTLTGLRGVAATVVMLYHFSYSEQMNSFLIGRGYLAVDLFFVLSGFVMALSYGHLFAGRIPGFLWIFPDKTAGARVSAAVFRNRHRPDAIYCRF